MLFPVFCRPLNIVSNGAYPASVLIATRNTIRTICYNH